MEVIQKMIFIDDNELVGVYVDNHPGKLSIITQNCKTHARYTPLTGDPLASFESALEQLEFSPMPVQLSKRTASEKRFLERFSCGFCSGTLGADICGAKIDQCSYPVRILRLGTALKEYRARRRFQGK